MNMMRSISKSKHFCRIVISEFLERHSKAKRTRAPAYSRVLIYNDLQNMDLARKTFMEFQILGLSIDYYYTF